MKLFGARSCPWQALLAYVLKAEYGLSPLPEIARTPQGKPHFPDRPDLHFSVSHTGDLVLCAVSACPVGTDIETIRPRRDSLPRYALTEEEQRGWQALGRDWQAFYTLWTRKEAWCKYTGQGLRALWGQTPPKEGLCWGQYAGDGWRAAVCGQEQPPETICWLEKGDLP